MKLSLKSPDELKPIIGAYSALARNNAYLTVKDIMDQLHIKQSVPKKNYDFEANIEHLDLFTIKLSPEQESDASRLLRKHFPFLDLMEEIRINADGQTHGLSFKGLSRFFISALHILSWIRDNNIHYVINDSRALELGYRKDEDNWGKFLIKLFAASYRTIKDRYKTSGLLSTDTFAFLSVDSQYLREGKRLSFNYSWLFSPVRIPDGEEMNVFTHNTAGNKVQLDRLTELGIIMTVALFTDKRYMFSFLKETGLFDRFSSSGQLSQCRIIKEIISVYSIRLPARKLDISVDATQVKLDMLNELMKCPDEIYDVLPDSIRVRFNGVGRDGTPVLMKRYSDRFCSMVLKYFDVTKAFDTIRFQVNSGALRYKYHDMAEYMDGVPRERIVQDSINSFGRIQDVEAARCSGSNYLGFPLARVDEAGSEVDIPYITNASSRYIFNDNLIGISLRGDILPRILSNKDEGGGRFKVVNESPDCWLSTYELPALAFYYYLTKTYHQGDSVEGLLTNIVRQYESFFEDVADGKISSLEDVKIPLRNIPEKISTFLAGASDNTSYARHKQSVINSMINETVELLARLAEDRKTVLNKDNKIGKRSFVKIRPGKMAGYLAKDIVRFQRFPDGHPEKKLTSQQYAILYGMLATFSKDLEAACNNAGLLTGPCAHPFLKRVFDVYRSQMHSTLDFYEYYLSERKSFLEGTIADNEPFLFPNRKKWSDNKDADYYRRLAKRYIVDEKTGRKNGIFLPRGIFLSPSLEIIEKCCPKTWTVLKEKMTSSRPVNMYYTILTYIEEECQDQNQAFYYDYDDAGYNQKHLFYELFKRALETDREGLRSIIDQQKGNSSCYSRVLTSTDKYMRKHVTKNGAPRCKPPVQGLDIKLRKAYSRMCEVEKTKTRYMVQDVILFLLSRDVVGKAGKALILSEVGPDTGALLDQIVDKVVTYYNKKGHKKRGIVQESVNIKDYGEVYKVLSDKRIDSLLDYQDDSVSLIPLESIKQELDNYDRERVPVVSSIHSYERRVVESNPVLFSNSNERYDFKYTLNADSVSSNIDKQSLRVIRNAFSHNQYPNPIIVDGESTVKIYEPNLPEIAKAISQRAKELSKKKQ